MPESPLAKKLGIKPGQKILIMNAPEGYLKTLGTLPAGAEVKTGGQGVFDFVQLFVYNKADIESHAAAALRATKPGGLLWFAYPKKTSGMNTNITRDTGWDSVHRAGWRPVAQVAIDDTWTGFRFRPAAEVKSREV